MYSENIENILARQDNQAGPLKENKAKSGIYQYQRTQVDIDWAHSDKETTQHHQKYTGLE